MCLVSQVLQQCLPSVSTLEVMLNSYVSLPPCEWVSCLPAHVSQVSCPFCWLPWLKLQLLQGCLSIFFFFLLQEHQPFFQLLSLHVAQPRSLQHLCRCALRQHLGDRCFTAVSLLDIPASVRDYLLLRNDGTLR